MSTRYEAVLAAMSEEDVNRLYRTVIPKKRWGQYFPRIGEVYGLNDAKDFRDFCAWMVDQNDVDESEDEVLTDDSFLHDKPYWFDEAKGVYIVHLKNKKRPLLLKQGTWGAIKDAYSNWDGSPSSVNEICRKFGMARKTVVELLRTMGMTHDSSPWTEEEVAGTGEGQLTEDLLRKKEERVLVKAEQIEYRKVQKDAQKYRRLDLVAKSLQDHFSHGPKLNIPKLNLNPSLKPYSVLISPTDFHWGKYATGMFGDGYDRDVAKARLFEVTEKVLSRIAERGAPEKIILGVGGDGLHIDNNNRATTRGTYQDCDGNPTELAHTYVDMCREYISFVAQFADVEVYVVPGNHDFYTSALLRAALIGWFHREQRIKVIENLSPRQTFLYGKNLLSFIHGDQGAVKDYASIIAGEDPKMWGESNQRFIFTGHLHTERELPQFGNITVYRMPSLAGTDYWHHSKGYKSRKALIGYIIDKEDGVIATEIVPVKGKKEP